MSDEFEKEVAKCNTLTELRDNLQGMENTVQDSLSPVKVLLCTLFSRLKFHNEFIHMFISATTDEQSQFWSAIIAPDSTLTENGVYRKETMDQHPTVMEFITHCCQSSHYTFDILKCGKDDYYLQANMSSFKYLSKPPPYSSYCSSRRWSLFPILSCFRIIHK